MKFSCPAHVFGLFIRSGLGGSKAGQEGVRENFKDRRLYLECCHSCSGLGQIFQGVDLGRGKNRHRRASSLTKSGLLQTKGSQQHTDVLPTTHAFIWILSFWLSFFWLNCLLLVIRWAVKGPWASSLLLLWNCWTGFKEIWQEARSQQ